MYYTYVLKSLKDDKLYIGSTINLKKRLYQHYTGQVKSTKFRLPIRLYAWREFDNIKDAALWEKKYKRSHGQLERDIKNKKMILYID